ncbi:MAG TPA: metallophosphoesterase [Candidatus Hypogeohydataceae bacterium YC38]|nr:metallophosphoesterase [Candidatus Brocadiales bacterium]
MKVGIIADTHDNLPMIKRALDIFTAHGVGAILHAGDFVAPFALKELLKPGIRLVGVFGNNDGEKAGLKELCREVHEAPYLFELGSRNILITHYIESVRDTLRKKADIVISGHTHEPEIQEGKPLCINPGECGGWLYGKPSVAIVDLSTSGGLEAHVIFLS